MAQTEHPDDRPGRTGADPASRPILTRQVFLATFQFSQGDYRTQHLLYTYLKQQHPDLTLSEWEHDELLAACARPAETIVTDSHRHASHASRPSTAIWSTLHDEL